MTPVPAFTLILSFLLLLAPGLAVAEGFLFPRDKEIHYVSGIELSRMFKGEFLRQQQECFKENIETDFCRHYRGVEVPIQLQPVSLQRILDTQTQLFFVGERHSAPLARKLLRSWLSELKEKFGYTHLALEAFNSVSQKEIDLFLQDKIIIDDLRNLLSSQWSYRVEEYLELVLRAKELGLEVIALDDRGGHQGKEFSQMIAGRDAYWSSLLKKFFIKNKSSRVVVLSGKMHAFQTFSKKQINIKTVIEQLESIDVLGQSVMAIDRSEKNLMNKLIESPLQQGEIGLYMGDELAPYTSALIFGNEK